MKTFIFVFAVLIAASSIFATSEAGSRFPRKQLAGPPSEFGLHRLPTPLAGAVAEGSAMFEANLSQHPMYSNRVTYTQPLVVDSSEAFAFCVVSPHEDLLTVALTDPQGNNIPLASYATKVRNARVAQINNFFLYREYSPLVKRKSQPLFTTLRILLLEHTKCPLAHKIYLLKKSLKFCLLLLRILLFSYGTRVT
jgi:hypothetical protein